MKRERCDFNCFYYYFFFFLKKNEKQTASPQRSLLFVFRRIHVITVVRKTWPIGCCCCVYYYSIYSVCRRRRRKYLRVVVSSLSVSFTGRIFRLHYTHTHTTEQNVNYFSFPVFCLRFVIVMIQLVVTLGSGHGKWYFFGIFAQSRHSQNLGRSIIRQSWCVFRLRLTNVVDN